MYQALMADWINFQKYLPIRNKNENRMVSVVLSPNYKNVLSTNYEILEFRCKQNFTSEWHPFASILMCKASKWQRKVQGEGAIACSGANSYKFQQK